MSIQEESTQPVTVAESVKEQAESVNELLSYLRIPTLPATQTTTNDYEPIMAIEALRACQPTLTQEEPANDPV